MLTGVQFPFHRGLVHRRLALLWNPHTDSIQFLETQHIWCFTVLRSECLALLHHAGNTNPMYDRPSIHSARNVDNRCFEDSAQYPAKDYVGHRDMDCWCLFSRWAQRMAFPAPHITAFTPLRCKVSRWFERLPSKIQKGSHPNHTKTIVESQNTKHSSASNNYPSAISVAQYTHSISQACPSHCALVTLCYPLLLQWTHQCYCLYPVYSKRPTQCHYNWCFDALPFDTRSGIHPPGTTSTWKDVVFGLRTAPQVSLLRRRIRSMKSDLPRLFSGENLSTYKDQTNVFFDSPSAYFQTYFPPHVNQTFPLSPFPASLPGVSSTPSKQNISGKFIYSWRHEWPTHLIFFGNLLHEGIRDTLERQGYKEVWKAGREWEGEGVRKGGARVWKWSLWQTFYMESNRKD